MYIVTLFKMNILNLEPHNKNVKLNCGTVPVWRNLGLKLYIVWSKCAHPVCVV